MVLIGGRLAAGAAICWLLQGFGPNHDSNTEERLRCVTVMVRNRILQQPANGSSCGPMSCGSQPVSHFLDFGGRCKTSIRWLLLLILATTAGVGQPLQVRCPLVASHTGNARACVRVEERAAEL